jgi:hypothetical protein
MGDGSSGVEFALAITSMIRYDGHKHDAVFSVNTCSCVRKCSMFTDFGSYVVRRRHGLFRPGTEYQRLGSRRFYWDRHSHLVFSPEREHMSTYSLREQA